MKKLLACAAIALFCLSFYPSEAGAFYLWRYREDATDCTALTDGKVTDLCYENDADTFYKCEPTAGDCDTAAEWRKLNTTGNATTATALAANGANCGAGNSPLGVDASGAVEGCFAVLTAEVDGSTTNEIQNLFETIATSSGTSPVADSATDTLTLTGGTGITITGVAGTDTITIATTVVDTDTNANTICTGTTTYLDGEGNCDDISAVYESATSNDIDPDRLAGDATDDNLVDSSIVEQNAGTDISADLEEEGVTCTGCIDATDMAADSVGESELIENMNFTGTGDFDFGGGVFQIPNSGTLPGTCEVGDAYMDTDATTGQRFFLCESANTWALQGDGGGGGSESTTVSDTTTINLTLTGSDITADGLYTAGDGLTLTGADFDFDGGDTPQGELGGTWASPTIDDNLTVTGWVLGTSSATTFTSGTVNIDLLDGVGAVDMDYGSADITDHTFTTDGTGDSEIVLPNDSIGAAEVLDTGDFTMNSLSVATEVYDATGWNGDNTVPTKDAVRDKIETLGAGSDTNSVKEYYWPASATLPLQAADSIPPISKDAGTNVDQLAVLFDSGTDECRSVTFKVPSDVESGSTITFRALWYSTATSGSVVWDFRHTSGDTEGETWDDTLTTESASSDAVQGTTKLITVTTWTETLANLGWAANDLVTGTFCRDGDGTAGTDDMAADAYAIGFGVEIPRA